MQIRHWRRALTTAILAVALSGCSLFNPPLSVPEGDAMCAHPPEPVWFGSYVENQGSRPATLHSARLGDAEGATLIEVLAIPEITQADGSTLLLGIGRDLATESPELWAVRQPVDGYVIQPGQIIVVAFQISRATNAEVAMVASQTVTYRIDGEPFDRDATSRLSFAIAPDCDAIED